MDQTTSTVLDEIVKRLGVVEAQLARVVNVPGEVGSSQQSSAGNGAGRKNETAEIAAYANQLRLEMKTWKEVLRFCKECWPGNKHVKNKEQVRAIWRRHYGQNRKRIN